MPAARVELVAADVGSAACPRGAAKAGPLTVPTAAVAANSNAIGAADANAICLIDRSALKFILLSRTSCAHRDGYPGASSLVTRRPAPVRSAPPGFLRGY